MPDFNRKKRSRSKNKSLTGHPYVMVTTEDGATSLESWKTTTKVLSTDRQKTKNVQKISIGSRSNDDSVSLPKLGDKIRNSLSPKLPK